MMLPRIADALDVTLDDLFTERTASPTQTESHAFDMDAVHNFPKDAQAIIMDALCHRTNFVNCNSWEFLKAEQNPYAQM